MTGFCNEGWDSICIGSCVSCCYEAVCGVWNGEAVVTVAEEIMSIERLKGGEKRLKALLSELQKKEKKIDLMTTYL